MFHLQQQEQLQMQQSSCTYFPQPSNENPNSQLPYSYPQPPTLPSQTQPPLYPPGTEPPSYAHPTQFTVTHVEYQAPPQFYVDPNAVSQNWTATQVDTITYDATLSVVPLNSSSNSNWMNQALVNNVIGSTPNQTKLVQPVLCEVCNIQCDTKDVYEKHIMGKKHQKNLQVKLNPATAIYSNTSNTTNNVSIVGQTGNGVGQTILGSSGLVNAQELERKKQTLLNSGAAVNSVQMCSICNVACNSLDAFSKHLSGRRHAAQAGLIAVDGIGPYIAAVRANDHFWNKGKKTTKINQSMWCEVCKVNCTSNDAYATHLSGKKHLKNLENLEKSKNGTSLVDTPAATNLVIGPVENPGASDSSGVNVQRSEKRAALSEATKEDLETKKRKVMQSGAAAYAVRVCTICNVVCNNQKVFRYHLTGQKHAAMVKKQAVTPQTTTAA